MGIYGDGTGYSSAERQTTYDFQKRCKLTAPLKGAVTRLEMRYCLLSAVTPNGNDRQLKPLQSASQPVESPELPILRETPSLNEQIGTLPAQ